LDETLRIRVYGFIEYETMGKRMHHDFWYTRSNAFLGLFAILGGEVPMPEMERLTQIGWIAIGNFEEEGYPLHSGNPNRLWFRFVFA
jgi:hypothetical protein